MDALELKGLVLKRYNVNYTITSANKLKSILTLANETLPLEINPPSTIIVFPTETGLEDGTYQTKVVERDIALKDSAVITKTFSVNPIRKPTGASVLLNSDKSITLNWTAPTLTQDGLPINNSTWAGYHFYVYNSTNAVVFATLSTSIRPGLNTFRSSILPIASGAYTVRIIPHLYNGGNGNASDALPFTIP